MAAGGARAGMPRAPARLVGTLLLATVLAAGALLPVAHANLVLTGPGVPTNVVSNVPQVHCTIVFTSSGAANCGPGGATGLAFSATHLRARVVGDGTVHAYVDIARAPGLYEQLASVTCDSRKVSCLVPFAFGMESGAFTLRAFATGKVGTTIMVDVEAASSPPLP